MTVFDIILVAFAALDVVFVIAMVVAVLRFRATAVEGEKQVRPAVREAKALADLGKALAIHAKEEATAVASRVSAVAGRVRRRYETTRHIIQEIRPQAKDAVNTVQSAGRKAQAMGDLAQRLKRVKTAAEAASKVRREQVR